MNFRTEERNNIPPVRGVLTGKQARCIGVDLFGTKKNYFISDEVNNQYHLTIPSDDGYKNFITEADELIDGLWKINRKMLVNALIRVCGKDLLKELQEAIK